MATEGYSREALLAARSGVPPLAHLARFQDVDAAGIVFFPRILEYFHDAYAAYLRAAGCPLERVLAAGIWAAPIKRSEAHFLRPIRFGDALETALVAARFEGSALSIGYRTTLREGEAVAIGSTVAVVVDRATFRRIEPPEELRRAFSPFEATPGAAG